MFWNSYKNTHLFAPNILNNENMRNKFLLTLLWYCPVILMYFVIISNKNKII